MWQFEWTDHVIKDFHRRVSFFGFKMNLLFLVCLCVVHEACGGMLMPRESESRTIMELNGMWTFRADSSSNRKEGMEKKWWEAPLKSVRPANYYNLLYNWINIYIKPFFRLDWTYNSNAGSIKLQRYHSWYKATRFCGLGLVWENVLCSSKH